MSMTVMEIDVVSVPVADQDRAKSFYSEQLGFEEVADAELGDGMRWVQLRPTSGGASVTLVTWFDRMPPGSLQGLVLATDDVHGDHERLRERGVEFRQGVEEAPWGTFTTFEDPDGNGWVLQQPRRG
jgi:catechol 2,3-dioxygenase-like lactoylglutathione lyase family enzyme